MSEVLERAQARLAEMRAAGSVNATISHPPWRILDEDPLRVVASDARQTVVSETPAPRTNPEALADARLIAAAPDLLEAAESVLTKEGRALTITAHDWSALRAAVAKAKGGGPMNATIAELERRVREVEENAEGLTEPTARRMRLVAITLAEVAQAMRRANGAPQGVCVACGNNLCADDCPTQPRPGDALSGRRIDPRWWE